MSTNLTKIGNSCFNSCENLTSVSLPSSITEIGDGAFGECTKLSSIDLPSSITKIGEAAFLGCTKLTSIVLPSSLNKIGKNVFTDCTALTEIKFNAYGSNWYSTTKNDYTSGSLCVGLNNPMLDEEMIKTLFDRSYYYYKQ